MGLFESIFGSQSQSTTSSTAFDSRTQGLANQAFNNAYSQYAPQQNNSLAQQQLGHYYNAALMNRLPMTKWMINGEACYSIKEFAAKLYPDDPEQQMMLVLRFGEI